MSEPVSSPSLLTITAPPAKPARDVSDDFSKQLSSLSEADESRSHSPKEDVRTKETSANSAGDKKEVSSESEQKVDSVEKTDASSAQDDTPSVQNKDANNLPENEAAVESLAEGLVVAAPIIVAPASEELVALEELLPVETTEAIVSVSGETPGEAGEQADELLDLENDSKLADGKTSEQLPDKAPTEGIASKADVPETIAASAEIVARKPGEQEPVTPVAIKGEETSRIAPIATEETANNESRGEQNKEKTTDPSLLSKLNDAAIQGDGKESSETETPAQKPVTPSASLPAVAVAAVEALSSDETNLDTNDSTGRSASVGATEERANQRAELAAAAKTRTNSAPTIDPSRFVSRVTKAFEAAQQQGGGPIRIRLSPPELGMLQVQIEVKEGVLTASLEAETHAARNLLLENLPALRERLAEQQISVEKFDVDVRDESSGPDYEQADSRESNADAQGNRQDQQQPPSTEAGNAQEVRTNSTATPSTISFDNDRVDLVA